MATKNKDLDSLVQYAAERLTAYMDMPAEERRAQRKQRAMQRGSWQYRWFGMLPYAIAHWIGSFKRAAARHALRRKRGK